jgi:uncharacterized protein (TIGR00299 family) protein
MFLGALIDLGADREKFLSEIGKLGLNEFSIDFNNVHKNGIAAAKVDIFDRDSSAESHHHHGRNLSDIKNVIENSGLSENVKKKAVMIFENLGRAEAKVHNSDINEIHFHEAGAVDSIADIAGACILLDMLKIDEITYDNLNDGRGFVNCAHGMIPVPVPAVCKLAEEHGVKINISDENGEMITPTGMALLASLAREAGGFDGKKILKTGYGAGNKEFKRPNVLRAFLLESGVESAYVLSDTCVLLECNIDDQTAESLGFCSEILIKSGAKDVFFTPVFTKKNRPAYMLSVICVETDTEKLKDLIFKNTTTLGIRKSSYERHILPRGQIKVNTKYGEIAVKTSEYNGATRFHPEYSDVAEAALANNAGYNEIYNEVIKQIQAK